MIAENEYLLSKPYKGVAFGTFDSDGKVDEYSFAFIEGPFPERKRFVRIVYKGQQYDAIKVEGQPLEPAIVDALQRANLLGRLHTVDWMIGYIQGSRVEYSRISFCENESSAL